ncbi:MAG: hypothetical protein ACHQT8_00865 [Chlamydiales bacterium]
MSIESSSKVPTAFIWRRVHSLMGLWLVLFLMEHLFVNSQAALLLGESGKGFVQAVNAIHNFPYLQTIEITLIGVPLFIHLVWGIKYLLTSKSNSFRTNGASPSLPEYERNHAYTWQRITSWILVIGLTGHIVKFRFLEYPDSLVQGITTTYFVKLKVDNGLYTVAERVKVKLYDEKAIQREKEELDKRQDEQALVKAAEKLKKERDTHLVDHQKAVIFTAAQEFQDRKAWVAKLDEHPLAKGEVLGVSDNFGTASLLVVRDTFKSPIYVGLYTVFVLAACFHAFNGLWTFLITWGVVLRMSAQRFTVKMAYALMLLITFLGLIAIWGTYWLNLRT